MMKNKKRYCIFLSSMLILVHELETIPITVPKNEESIL